MLKFLECGERRRVEFRRIIAFLDFTFYVIDIA
jgi:hypothetical protein